MLQVLGGLVSATVQLIATVAVVFCFINFFSLKPGGSKKFVVVGFFYFFSSMVGLLGYATVLMSLGSIHLINLIGVLLGAALIHLSFGVLLFILYIGNIILER